MAGAGATASGEEAAALVVATSSRAAATIEYPISTAVAITPRSAPAASASFENSIRTTLASSYERRFVAFHFT